MRRFITVRNLFSLFLIVWFAYGVYEARSYSYLARIFPFYVSLILLVCAIINLIQENLPKVKQASPNGSKVNTSDLSSNWEIPMSMVWRRFIFFVGTILALYVATYLIGYPLAITLLIFIFYRQIAEASWLASIIAAAAGLGFLALASKVLNMYWPEGLINKLLELPWPLR
jgi:hypothetical protein